MADDNTDPNTVRITLKDVYTLLVEVSKKVDATQSHGPQLEDHEKRIRAVERNVWIIVGIGVVAQILVPLIWTQILP